jgi:hypothetical protein
MRLAKIAVFGEQYADHRRATCGREEHHQRRDRLDQRPRDCG